MTKITTPVAFGQRYEYPPGINPGLVDQTYYSEFPEKAGFVNDQIG